MTKNEFKALRFGATIRVSGHELKVIDVVPDPYGITTLVAVDEQRRRSTPLFVKWKDLTPKKSPWLAGAEVM